MPSGGEEVRDLYSVKSLLEATVEVLDIFAESEGSCVRGESEEGEGILSGAVVSRVGG